MVNSTTTRVHATREDYSHLTNLEWLAVGRMAESIGDSAVGAMLYFLGEGEQHSTIAKFIQHELDEAKQKNALLYEQGTQQRQLLRDMGAQQAELLRQQSAQQAELLRHQQANASAGSVRTHLNNCNKHK